MTGRLVLVVGPSGAGKDTLLDVARELFKDSSAHSFPRRLITRRQDAGGEDHIPVTPGKFELMEANGDFALSWRAHNLSYGVPNHIVDEMDRGKVVIVNVSRGVIEQAYRRFVSVRVACIMASEEILRARLRARGRESEIDIENRLRQASAYTLKGGAVYEIDNGGPLEEGVRQFIKVING